ncbi:hypothetical protein C8J57DRAFT_1709662 [Mycena rebaudengoi]|nr:hypothetical protein C8J57DRAFT_1709662 [Mycena rebaudengoi]
MNHEGAAVSRATSVSRTKKEDSTLSRNRSLINKNVAPQDLRPSDILIERFVAWKAIVKQLITYFEGLADIQNDTAKELTKLGAVLQVPFRAGNQFLGEGGLQDIFYDIRDKTRVVADEHANFGRTIDGSIVQHLQKLRTEIKAHLKNVQNDTGKLATNVAKERELSTRLISELSSDISALKTTPMNITSKTDPYVANAAVVRQLQKQVQEENLLQKSIIAMQKNSAQFEEGIVRAIQSAWHTYDEWQARMGTAVAGTHAELSTHMRSLAPDREWLAFSKRSTHLVDPETPLRNTTTFEYPSKDDPSIVPVHTGVLERKKRYTRVYRESFFVLTPAGFLHEYAASSPTAPGGREPLLSLFLPMCTLGAPSGADSKSHKFHIEARKDGSGTGKGGTVRRRSLSIHRDHTWSFRARSREDMMGWWNDIRVLCARYLVPSEQMERSGPVAAAVRAAGYTSGEDGTDGTDEGSSVDEDELEYVDAEESHPPSYSHQHEMGASAYPLEKGHSRAPSTSTDAGASVSRRPSKRQQEKAPEVHPHFADDAGAEKVLPGGVAESKFTEHI